MFDWTNAPSSDVDLVLGFFIMSLVPTEDGRAMGTRYTPDTLKQLKTGLKNMMTFFLKRTDNIDSYNFFTGCYTSKRNKWQYGAVMCHGFRSHILFILASVFGSHRHETLRDMNG